MHFCRVSPKNGATQDRPGRMQNPSISATTQAISEVGPSCVSRDYGKLSTCQVQREWMNGWIHMGGAWWFPYTDMSTVAVAYAV